MNRQTVSVVLGLTLGVAGLGASRGVDACGGCFAPPGAVQVVTDHRMVLSLSPTRTVLWDQIRYSGRPADFSWILPIRNGGDVRIELGDNQFVSTLDNLTAPVLNPPPRPYPPYCGAERNFDSASGAAPPPQAAADAGVAVLQESVVGPYMTVTLRGEDPMALRNWLRDNGYSVPTATESVIDYYVGLHMDFIALKLRPGEGVDRMQPVRISSPGYVPSLPLRMIAAGVADKVGLLLMVIASTRIEAMNFPNGEIANTDLTYDFNTPTQPSADFAAAFGRLNRANGNRLWLTESALTVNRYSLLNPLMRQPGTGAADVAVAYESLGDNATVTRLRADLTAGALDRDLALAASERPARERLYQYGTVLNRPAEYPPCDYSMTGYPVGTPGRSTTYSCATTHATHGGRGALASVAALLLGLAIRRRNRRSIP